MWTPAATGVRRGSPRRPIRAIPPTAIPENQARFLQVGHSTVRRVDILTTAPDMRAGSVPAQRVFAMAGAEDRGIGGGRGARVPVTRPAAPR